jgi:hypothetical protein
MQGSERLERYEYDKGERFAEQSDQEFCDEILKLLRRKGSNRDKKFRYVDAFYMGLDQFVIFGVTSQGKVVYEKTQGLF